MIDVLLPGERETLRGPATDLAERADAPRGPQRRRQPVRHRRRRLRRREPVGRDQADERGRHRQRRHHGRHQRLDRRRVAADRRLDPREPRRGPVRSLDTESPEPTSDTLPVTAVRKDGRWYLSLFYTAAEAARAETGEDIPAEGITPTGGDSPEAAMDAFLDGVEALDLSAVIASLNPNEFEALQRYAPLFIDEAQASLDDVDLTMSISDRDYEVTGSGDTRSVTVAAITFDVSAEGESVSMELRGRLLDRQLEQRAGRHEQLRGRRQHAAARRGARRPAGRRGPAGRRSRPRSTTTSTPGFIAKEVDGTLVLQPDGHRVRAGPGRRPGPVPRGDRAAPAADHRRRRLDRRGRRCRRRSRHPDARRLRPAR